MLAHGFRSKLAAKMRGLPMYRGQTEDMMNRRAFNSSLLVGAALVAAPRVTRSQEILVRTRPEKGLLGGMTEVPGSDWLAGQDDSMARQQAPVLKGLTRWQRKAGLVTHVFTHFPLELAVYTATVERRTRAPQGMRWVAIAALEDEALPNVMRKVIAHALA